MEGAPAAQTGARNGGFAMPAMASSSSQPSRKEWRVVSEDSIRNSGDEGLDRPQLVQSDERLIYEDRHGIESVDVDFRSINVDGGLNGDIMQQRLLAVSKQREELQQMEIELHAQVITRSEIVELKNIFDTQIEEHVNANVHLQEQLHEKEQKIRELERRMDEKERELHAIRMDHQAAWDKEDLLREQSKELHSYMREKDNSEAEKVQHIKQIHDLQERFQEKDRLILELQDQHRTAQEAIRFKDDQLREAQAWMTRAQEMDALQSSTNHNLQVELRERTEHYNQLWLGCQRQSAEMERLHMYLQQLQLELADAREKSGVNVDGSLASLKDLNTASELEKRNDSQLEVNGDASQKANSGGLQSENPESASSGNISTLGDRSHVVAFAPSSLHGMPTYIPNGQMTPLHQFVMHQQGVSHPQHVLQSQLNSVSSASSTQKHQQPQPDGQHDQNISRANALYGYGASGNGQIFTENSLHPNISQGLDAGSVNPSPNGEVQVLNSIDKSFDNDQSPQSLQQISSQFREALSLNTVEQGKDTKVVKPVIPVSDHGIDFKNTMFEHSDRAVNAPSFEAAPNSKSSSETATDTASSVDLADTLSAAGQKNNVAGKPGISYLLDERALLASIARTIGSGVRIRISTTLPNRLAKMLAPLHWHDYKKKYGKLDDFVASHSELFSIEGGYIQLREGAQETIAATAAVAEVAAAAPSLYSSLFPSVSVTPMAHSQQLKKAIPHEPSYVNPNGGGNPSQLSARKTSHNLNGGSSHRVNGGKYPMGNNRTGHLGGLRHV